MTDEKREIYGNIFNIQRFSIHDGSGIRTLVFLKGCPLRCIWCANPESQSFSKEVMFFKAKCIGCGKCRTVCRNSCIDEETFEINKTKCVLCGECADACYADAKKPIGEYRSVSELMKEIEKDRVFFRNSKGGVTVGGGEPLAQPEFTEELLKRCKASNLHTAIETCGFAKWEKVKNIFGYLDQVFFDLKHMNSEKHKRLTNVGNEIILDNARRVARLGKDVIFRLPLIPGCNDDIINIEQTGDFVAELSKNNPNIRIEVLEYHSLGENKYYGLSRSYELAGLKSDKKSKEQCEDMLSAAGCNVVRK